MTHWSRTVGGYLARWVRQADGTSRYVLQHRDVMATVLGRPLESSEVVHHIDGDRTNNDPTNLRLMTAGAHRRLHSGNGAAKLRRKTRAMLAWEVERGEPMEQVFAAALERSAGNVSAAAESIGMSRETFRWWMLRLGIELQVTASLPEAV